MIKLPKQVVQALHNGSRKEFYKLELLDKHGIKKCDLDMIDGGMDVDANADVQKVGDISFLSPCITRRVETTPPSNNPVLTSCNGVKFLLGVGVDGCLYTVPIKDESVTQPTGLLQVADNGDLFTDGDIVYSVEYKIMDNNGYTWEVGVEANGDIFTELSIAKGRKIYYTQQKIEVEYLTDKVKVYMGIVVNGALKWYSLGVFFMVKHTVKNGLVKANLFDETILVQQDRILEPKLFQKGTQYIDVLKYLLISCNIIKINIQPTSLTLQTDIILDDSKNKLQWFNYIVEQINYTNLNVDANGWFVSKKYTEPSPSNVSYIYADNQLSIIKNIDMTMDTWQVYNVFKRVVSHPQLGVLTSMYINDDPTDKYSTANRGKLPSVATVDNIAGQEELDNLTRKLAFNAKQVQQDVIFKTLNMPHHEVSEVIELRSKDVKGIFVEYGWSLRFNPNNDMEHKAKRLVVLK